MLDRPSTPSPASAPIPRPADHPSVASGKVGVLLLNLGTPDGTGYWAMRRYLKEFLSDRRVIELPRLIWWPLLNGIVLTWRPSAKGRDYAKIWNTARDEGPLKTITRNQADKLGRVLAGHPRVVVDWAMRYANPSTDQRIRFLQDQGCDRILLVPLYPQYAAPTTATAADQAFRTLMKLRWQPAVRVAPAWHDDPVYIEALAQSVRAHVTGLGREPEILLVSFHGMPRAYLEQGDPYHCQCLKTGRLLREALAWPPERFVIAFQSIFGRAEWLRPYTDETITALAQRGVKSLAVIAPGFTADCLETLEELDVENRHYFESNGGGSFSYIPCLNDSELGLTVIETIVRRELMGWV